MMIDANVIREVRVCLARILETATENIDTDQVLSALEEQEASSDKGDSDRRETTRATGGRVR